MMDPAIYFPVTGTKEERTVLYRPALRIYPVIDPGNTGQVIRCEILSGAPLPSGTCDTNVREDIRAVVLYPGYEIFDNAFLAPPPLLAAPATLPAVLE
jgi:hypothetical protein